MNGLRVVRGTPTDQELAALLVVLAAVGAPPQGQVRGPEAVSRWADPAARHRRPRRTGAGGGSAGPHAWRTSTWPG